MNKPGNVFCGPVAIHPVDHPPVEIDSEQDLQLCELLARRSGIDEDLRERLKGVKAFVMDFDGVHTDDKAHVDENGIESVTVARGDGMGIELLRKANRCEMLILSKERNSVVRQRAAKMKIECTQSCDDKVLEMDKWLAAKNIQWSDVLYIGNDINDLPPLQKAGVSACPSDAHISVSSIVDWVVPANGGNGAIRAVAELLLECQ